MKKRNLIHTLIFIPLLYLLFINPFISGWLVSRKVNCNFNSLPKYEEEFYDLVWFIETGNTKRLKLEIPIFYVIRSFVCTQRNGKVENFSNSYLNNISLNIVTQSETYSRDISLKTNIDIMRFNCWLTLTSDRYSIINFYVENMSLGHNIYGIEDGANFYFSKEVSDLTNQEICELIFRSFNPTRYSIDSERDILDEKIETTLIEYYSI